MVKIGVCDVSEDEARRTIYLLESQMGKNTIGNDNVIIIAYTLEMVMLDLEDHKFDCDIFISELSFNNGSNGVQLAKYINETAPSCNIIFYVNMGANCAGLTSVLISAIDNHTIWLKLRHIAELPFIAWGKRRIHRIKKYSQCDW